LYVNGAPVNTRTATASLHTSGENVYIGRKSNGSQTFDGIIDEARIAHVARSPDWIRACWLNVASNGGFQTYGGVANVSDADGDNIPDAWETKYFPTTDDTDGHPDEDWDGDGMSDRAEYIAGTDPTNAVSRFALDLTWSNGRATVTFPAFETTDEYGAIRRYYSLDRATGRLLNAWLGIEDFTNVQGAGQMVIYSTNPDTNTAVFFRGRSWLKDE